MKKVLLLSSIHPALDPHIFRIAKTLTKNGYKVTLVAQHKKEEEIEGVKIIGLSEPKNRFCRFLFLTKKVYKIALEQKADVYHFHDPDLLPWMWLLKKKTKTKLIYDVHEDYPELILTREWIPKILKIPLSIFFNWFEKCISKSFDFIIAATPYIASRFKNHNVVYIGANFPDLEIFNSLENSKFQKTKSEPFILIYAGGLEKIRGIKEIVEALSMVNPKYNIKLKLFGKFSEKKFDEEVKKLKGWEKVEYFGWIPLKEVYKEIKNSDVGLICLHPIKRYMVSLPLKMFEYMAAGISVIVSNFPLWKEIIEKENCGICVDPLNPKEIAKAVEYLIEHPDEAKKMGENGRKAVLEKYNWGNESKKLLKIYEELTR
jgi:glycosyltransferase involved in cell wall biosynthesis